MPSIIRQYIEYIKDNPKHYWFRARWYGWGWVPATIEGWTVIGVYVVLALLLGLTVDENSTVREVMFTFFLPLTFLTVTLIRICYKTGERPYWNWGPKKK